MSDAPLLHLYDECKKLAKEVNLSIYIEGDSIYLEKDTKEKLGGIYSVNELFTYICGYHEGYGKGKLDNINYSELLRKYIQHVEDCEGMTFLEDTVDTSSFSDEELNELTDIAGFKEEIDNE